MSYNRTLDDAFQALDKKLFHIVFQGELCVPYTPFKDSSFDDDADIIGYFPDRLIFFNLL